MDSIKSLAKILSAQRNQPEALWAVALVKAQGLVTRQWIQEIELEQLARAARSPRQLLTVVEYAARMNPREFDYARMATRIDESPYPMTDWLEAIETFHDWISSHGKSTDLKMLLGYITCCTEADPNASTTNSLKETVRSMLERFGFEG